MSRASQGYMQLESKVFQCKKCIYNIKYRYKHCIYLEDVSVWHALNKIQWKIIYFCIQCSNCVDCVGAEEMRNWLGSLKGRHHSEDLDVDRRKILK
jgi:hypothetical protein